MYSSVEWCSLRIQRVHKGAQGEQRCSRMQPCSRVKKHRCSSLKMYNGGQGCTKVLKDVQCCSRVNKGAQGCTMVVKGEQSVHRCSRMKKSSIVNKRFSKVFDDHIIILIAR